MKAEGREGVKEAGREMCVCVCPSMTPVLAPLTGLRLWCREMISQALSKFHAWKYFHSSYDVMFTI